ncbi:dihydrolipoyl dehydrogenase [Roseomonas sp. KE2513]|uniref:dihydrolipoyl dehydrogenase n=1 Tax=Roseomonas sp. KE2513 TaxID=2479202 RepID=UPI0018DFA616|nr:dihydrolipoyl dehydrogenase [Roseomonas sp. KE2513]MBI0538833.1 dihydrolipoyl dehydrogenase [Roseomonas sp. KE2513]
MSDAFDIVIVGGGPGGYPAAIRAAQLGMRVACIERGERLGGTCLNVGCIPSKALLDATETYSLIRHGASGFGIRVPEVEFDLAGIMAHKERVVGGLAQGIDFLFRKHRITRVRGTGRIEAPDRVVVTPTEGGAPRTLTATRGVVIATGSDATPLPGIEVDEKRIVSSTGALSLPEVPRRLAIIGAGYIGLELGSVWRRLGAEVTVLEYLDRITPGLDAEIAEALQRVLEEQGFRFRLGTRVLGARRAGDDVRITVQPAQGDGAGAPEELAADVLLVAVGRRAFAEGLGLEALGVALDERRRVKVDARFQTSVPGVYAIGDVIAGPMLAHKAEEEGIALAEILAGQAGHVDYGTIPAVVYTWPEVASVGRTEEELKKDDVAYRVGRFPFSANARARSRRATDGMVKVLADAATDRVLGVHIIGPDAGTLIHEAVLAMTFGASAEDIGRTTHAHPTLPEALREAALAVDGRPMHL